MEIKAFNSQFSKVIILSLSTLLFSAGVYARDWSIEVDCDGRYFLTHKKQFPVVRNLGEPEIVEIRNINQNYQLIIYISGVAGTSNIVEIKYAAVYKAKDGTILTQLPFEYKSLSNDTEWTQPIWQFYEDKITVEDYNSNTEETIQLE